MLIKFDRIERDKWKKIISTFIDAEHQSYKVKIRKQVLVAFLESNFKGS